MQESKDYKPNLSRGILLLGQPGMGKTTTGLQIAPSLAYVADCDNNLSGAMNYLKGSIPFLFDIIDLGALPEQRFPYLNQCLQVAEKLPTVNSFFLDGFSRVVDYIIDNLLFQQGRKQMQLQDWGTFLTVMKRTITMLRSTQKLFVASAHIRAEKDEVAGFVKYFPALPGQIQYVIGALFSDVWLCDVEERSGKYNYIVRTMPTTFYALKNSLGLPPVTDVNTIKQALNG